MHLLILSIALNTLFVSGYAQKSQNTLQVISIHIENLAVDSFPHAILRIQSELLEIPNKLNKLNLIQETDISEATRLMTTFIDAAYLAILEEDTIMTDLYKALKTYRLFIEGCAIERFNQINPTAICTEYPAYVSFLMNFLLKDRNLNIDSLLWQEQFRFKELIEHGVPSNQQPKGIINSNTQKILEKAIKYFAPTIP